MKLSSSSINIPKKDDRKKKKAILFDHNIIICVGISKQRTIAKRNALYAQCSMWCMWTQWAITRLTTNRKPIIIKSQYIFFLSLSFVLFSRLAASLLSGVMLNAQKEQSFAPKRKLCKCNQRLLNRNFAFSFLGTLQILDKQKNVVDDECLSQRQPATNRFFKWA